MNIVAVCDQYAAEWRAQILFAARIFLALLFIVVGWGKLMNFSGTVGYITSAGVPLPEVFTVLAILFELGGGIALLLGYHSRVAALALAVFTVVATAIYHRDIADPMQQIQALKNLAILGGLLVIFVHGCQTYRIPWQKE